MIEARQFTQEQIKKAYSRRSWIYSRTVAPMEFENHIRAIEKANIQPHERVLEVAVGPGQVLLEIVKRVDKDNVVTGIDTSPGMLAVARRTVTEAGYQNISLQEMDARKMDFPDDAFDVLYNGYMLDLIPLADMAPILSEFRRVLRPGGRLVLVNMSKRDEQLTWREKLYMRLPAQLGLYLMGACRPVLMVQAVKDAGFQSVEREFVAGRFPSEIVMGVTA
jgi:ubiquinone/menaquinone biosynthesis C-methylase UbiE